MKIVFLQNSATQPRCHKRFRSFRKAGIEGVVYSFNRNWYNVNLPTDIEINSLGELKPGSYLKRLILYLKKLCPIFKLHKGSLFYCYGQDMALVAALNGQRFIYEESDLMYLGYKNRVVRELLKWIDIRLQKKSQATILTSQGFSEFLYDNKPNNVFILPNKLDSHFSSIDRPKKKAFSLDKLRFAFIGLLRYERTMKAFIEEMVGFNPSYEFHIWGDGAESKKAFVSRLCEKYPQVVYHGPFKNPIDLPEIYSMVDVNFVCYDTNGLNERIAEPNKLYESTFFTTPILVSPNTYLSKMVSKWDNGFIVDCFDRMAIRHFFDTLTSEMLESKSEHCLQCNPESLIDSVEDTKPIVSYIEKLQKNS